MHNFLGEGCSRRFESSSAAAAAEQSTAFSYYTNLKASARKSEAKRLHRARVDEKERERKQEREGENVNCVRAYSQVDSFAGSLALAAAEGMSL